MRFQCLFCNFIIHRDDSETSHKDKCPSCGGGGMPVFSTDTYIFGRVLGDFVIRHKIGEEASGELFLAHQISLDRLVALKVFPKTSPKAGTSLKEARISASLNHPNLISVLALGEEDGICFIAMDYIKGISLQHYLETKRFIPVDEALYIIQQTSEALHFAWTEKRVIYKNIKPDNIMLSKNGVVKMMGIDFAMAPGDEERALKNIRSSQDVIPEPSFGRRTDIHSEIYSVGILLYQMLTGELPLNVSFESIIRQHLYKASKKITAKKLKILKEVGLLVSKMLEKNPEKRCQSLEYLIKKIIAIRKLTTQDKDFISSLYSVPFKKADSGILRKFFRAESKGANLNFAFKTAKFTGKPIYLMRKSQTLRGNPESSRRLDARLWRHDPKPRRQILLNLTADWTKTVERVRRFEKELNRVNSFRALINKAC